MTKLANVTAIFGPYKGENIHIMQVNTKGGKWIGITNQGIAATNLSGWRLMNSEGFIYVFPNINLDPTAILRIYEGFGSSTMTDLYTNSTAPIFSDSGDLITLLDAQCEIAAEYDTLGSAPAPTATPANLPLVVSATPPASVKSPVPSQF